MAGNYDRRTFLEKGLKSAAGAALLGTNAAFLLDACGATSIGTSASPGTAGTSSASPKRGGKIVISTGSEVDGFDPTQSHFDATGIMYAQTVFDPLAIAGADGSVKPYLAQSIEPNPDYTMWTIRLRPGVVFHDGTPLDADAAMFNFEKQLSSFLTGLALKNVERPLKIDNMTVALQMREPWVPFPYYLGGFYIGGQVGFMAAPSMLNNPNGARQPVGTGPYVFGEWVPNDHFTANRNPHYWRSGLPYLDQIEFQPIPDPLAQENGLKGGSIDILITSTPSAITDLRTDSSVVVIDDSKLTVGEPDMDSIMLNTASPPLDDLRVRQALAYATQPEKIISVVQEGVTPPSDGPFPVGPNHAATGYPSYDPARARQLVSDYQREKGPISFDLGTTSGSAPNLQEIELLQQMWQAVGIRTNLRQIEQTTYINNALLGSYQAYTWTQFGAPDPDLNYLWWSESTVGPIGMISINFSRVRDAELNQALGTGRTASVPATRAQAYQTVARRLAATVPYVWIDQAVNAVAAKPTVKNFNNFVLPDGSRGWPARGGTFPLVQMWLDR